MALEASGGPSLPHERGQGGGLGVRVPLPGGVRGGFPFGAGGIFNGKKSLDFFGLGKGRTKQMHFVAPSNHLSRQINRLRRSAPGRRIERFVGEKGDLHDATELPPAIPWTLISLRP